ncbi:2TM domain-containing protein [Enterobacter ludwigii]|nr:2TM domain-containing protein [Enterobacter ludwigii]
MTTVGEKVKTYCLQKAWSQEQLAEVTPLSVRTVQRTQEGQKPSLETLSALTSAFGVNVSDLSEETYVASNVLDKHISEAKIQIAQETSFDRILVTAVLVCTVLVIINYLFTQKSYWSVMVVVIWGSLVTFRAIRVFIIRGKLPYGNNTGCRKFFGQGIKDRVTKPLKGDDVAIQLVLKKFNFRKWGKLWI